MEIRPKKVPVNEVKAKINEVFNKIKDNVTVDVINHSVESIPKAYGVDSKFIDNITSDLLTVGSVLLQPSARGYFLSKLNELSEVQRAFVINIFNSVAYSHYESIVTMVMTHYFKTGNKGFLALAEIIIDIDEKYPKKTMTAEAVSMVLDNESVVEYFAMLEFILVKNCLGMDEMLKVITEELEEQ